MENDNGALAVISDCHWRHGPSRQSHPGRRTASPGGRPILQDWRFWFDPALYVLTALADGADQIVADEAAKTPYSDHRDRTDAEDGVFENLARR